MSTESIELIRLWLPIIISFGGLSLSLIGLCFTIWSNLAHKGSIKIFMFWASAAYSAELGELPLKGISMTITNTGKEDVVISHFGGYERGAKNGAMLMPPAGFVLPYKLAPRASAPLFWRYTEDMQNWRKLKDFIVFDTLLRRFKSDKDNFKEIKEKIRQEAETKKGK